MTKFSHLKQKLDVAQALSWLDLPEIAPNARIFLKFAGESNTQYYNEMLKKSGKRARQTVRNSFIDAAMLQANRRDDRELYPLYVIENWENLPDDKGKDVPYNPNNAQDLCEQLPDWLFDKIRDHAATPEKFLPETEELPPDPEELAGNSKSVSTSN